MPQHHYIYLLQEREFFVSKNNIYKLGKTTQDPSKRFAGYSKGTVIITVINVVSSDQSETVLLNIFREKFKARKDYGNEHFEGNLSDMIMIIQQHHIEQISLMNSEINNTPPLFSYENTLIEFLEKRTLPRRFGDSREPVVSSGVTFQMLSQFYREWCKDNGKKAITGAEIIRAHINNFLKCWISSSRESKRSKRVVQFYQIYIYQKDPEKEYGQKLEVYIPNSWAWHYTSSLEEIDYNRTLITPEQGLHLKEPSILVDKNYEHETWGTKKFEDLKYFTRFGWTLYIAVYDDMYHEIGLCSQKPPFFTIPKIGHNPAAMQKIREQVKILGGIILKSWLSEAENPFGLIARFEDVNCFIPFIIFPETDSPKDLYVFRDLIKEISVIWSGIIIFFLRVSFSSKYKYMGVKTINSVWFDDYIHEVYFYENSIYFDDEKQTLYRE